MAGCSSSAGIGHLKNLQNGVVPSDLFSSTCFLTTRLLCFSSTDEARKNTRLLHKRQRERLLVVNVMNQNTDSKSSPAVITTVGKDDIDYVEKEATHDSKIGGGGDDGGFIDGSGGNGKFPGGGGGGGGGGEDGGDDYEEKEFGPLLKFEEVIRETKARGASLPADMLEAAKTVGLRKVLLLRYLDLQGSVWPLGFLIRSSAMFRNRMLADPSFLFKLGTETVIDYGCATFAEVKKRGKDFWAEIELYAADMLVGLVVNVAIVGLLAPYARIGAPSSSQGFLGQMQRGYASLPSSVFEAERPGTRYSVNQRIAAYFTKGIIYGFVGFGCGVVGQGFANLIMTAKRNIKTSEDDIPVPPLITSAAVWGVFLGVSSNTRYQVINGLEHAVEASALAKKVPFVAMAFTVGVRFANNIYGGMQFVDWARLAGAQ